MAEENGGSLGVRAVIDASDVRKGAEEYIRAIEEMRKTSESAAGKMGDSLAFIAKQLNTLADATAATRAKITALFSEMANATPKDAGAAKQIASLQTGADTVARSCDTMMTRINATGATAKARMKEVREEQSFLKGQIEEMTARYAELGKRLESLTKKRGAIAAQPVSSDPLSAGVRDKKLATTDNSIAATRAEMQRILQITEEYKGQMQANNTEMSALASQTGNAGNKTVTLRTEMRNARQEVANMLMAGKENTAEFGRAVTQANRLTAAFKKSSLAVSGKSLAFNSFDMLATSVNGAVGALTTYMGVAGLFVKDQQELEAVQKDLQAVMSISLGVQQMITAATQISVKWDALKAAALAAVAAAEGQSAAGATASAAANAVNTGAAVANTAANWTLAASFRAIGAAIKSIPLVGWALAAIAAVVAAATAVTAAVKKAAAQSKEVRETEKREQQRLAAEQNALADEARKSAAAKVKGMNEDIASSAGKLISKYKELRGEWSKLGGSASKQNAFLRSHKEDFDTLGVSISNSVQANDFFINQTDSFVESCTRRARAIAAIKLAEANETESLKLQLENEDLKANTRDVKSRANFGKGDRIKGATFEDVRKGFHNSGQGGTFDRIWAYLESIYSKDPKTLQGLKNSWVEQLTVNGGSISSGKNKLTATSNVLASIDRERAYRERRSSDAQRIEANNRQIARNEAQNKELYKTAQEEGDAADKKNKYKAPPKSSGSGRGGKSDAERRYEAEQRYNELTFNEQKAFADKSADLAQLLINKMDANATQEIAQIRADKEKQLSELDDWIDGLARKRKELARDNWVGAKDGRTELQWSETAQGRRTDADWRQDLYSNNPGIKDVAEKLRSEISAAADNAENAAVDNVLSKYSGDTDRASKIKELKSDIAALEALIADYEKAGDKVRANDARRAQESAKVDLGFLSGKRDLWAKYLSEFGSFAEKAAALKEQFDHDTAGMDKNSPEYLSKESEYKEQSRSLYADEKWRDFSYLDYFSDWSEFADETLVKVRDYLREILEEDEKLDANGRNKLFEKYEKAEDALSERNNGKRSGAFGGIFGIIGDKKQEKEANKEEKKMWEERLKISQKQLSIAQKEYETKKDAFDKAEKGFMDYLNSIGSGELKEYMKGKSPEELAKEGASDGGGAFGQMSGIGDKIEQIRGFAQQFQGAQAGMQNAAQGVQGAAQGVQAAGAGAAAAGGGGGGGGGGVAVVDKIINGINDNVQSLGKLMEEVGVNMDNPDHNQNIEGLKSFMSASQSAADGWNSLKNGDLIGAAAGVIGSLTNLYDSFQHFMGIKSSMEEYIEAKEKYDILVEAWDKLISRKQEYMDISWGEEAKAAGEEAVRVAQKKEENTRKIAKQYNSAWQRGDHSAGHRFEEKMESQDWRNLEAATGVSFGKDSSKLFDLTAKQIESLMMNAQDVWAKLDDKQREYLESIMEAGDDINDTIESVQEKLTGITFDDMTSNFMDALSDMSSSAGDFVSDFKDTMRSAIVQYMLGEESQKWIKDYLTRYRSAMAKGYLTAGEVTSFKEELEQEARAEYEKRNDILNAIGLGNSAGDDSQSKGFAAASEDSVEELSGRMLAVNEAVYTIRDLVTTQGLAMTGMSEALAEVVTLDNSRSEWYNETLEIQRTSVSHLAAIERNTFELYGVNERLEKIERNTRNI